MSSNTVEQIKSRLNIVDVVSSYIKVQKAGANHKAICPFHNEKTPSLSVSPERGSFHCFGCNKGGDIFTFVQEMEGLDFVGALKVLAERAGVEIVWEGKREDRDEKERLYECLSAAADFFHSALARNKEALLYLKGRGLLAKTAEDFYLGFAEDSWDALYTHLSAKKYSGEEIEKAGLAFKAKEGRRGYYDRFRSRIMFPIADSAGRIVGFSGRIFRPETRNQKPETSLDAGAKYVNTPETLLYHKSSLLYGLHKAKRAIREKGSTVVVEGQMDLIMSHQAGIENTVAVSGTALTEEHLSMLKRFADKIVFAFDSDRAGFSAAKRGSAMALALGFDTLAARAPVGKDPADVVREDPEKWRDVIERAEHVVIFFLKVLRERNGGDMRAFRLSVEKELSPLLSVIKSPIDREHFIEVVASEIGISADLVRESVSRHRDQGAPGGQAASSERRSAERRREERREMIAREIEGIISWKKDFELREKYEKLSEEYGARPSLKMNSDEERALVFSVEKMYGGEKDIASIAHVLLANLEEELIREEQQNIAEEISLAGNRGEQLNGELVAELQKKHLEVSKRLAKIRSGRL